jgi:hypothetical protein
MVLWVKDYDYEFYSFTLEIQKICNYYSQERTLFMRRCCEQSIKEDFKSTVHPQPMIINEKRYPYTPSVVEMFTMLNSQIDEFIDSNIIKEAKKFQAFTELITISGFLSHLIIRKFNFKILYH